MTLAEERLPLDPNDPVNEFCPECHGPCDRIGSQGFCMGPNTIKKTFYWQCRNCGEAWITCPYGECEAIARPDERRTLSSSDPLGVTAVQFWRCTAHGGHRWHQLLEELSPEDLLGTEEEF